jgi:hypothetical protein
MSSIRTSNNSKSNSLGAPSNIVQPNIINVDNANPSSARESCMSSIRTSNISKSNSSGTPSNVVPPGIINLDYANPSSARESCISSIRKSNISESNSLGTPSNVVPPSIINVDYPNPSSERASTVRRSNNFSNNRMSSMNNKLTPKKTSESASGSSTSIQSMPELFSPIKVKIEEAKEDVPDDRRHRPSCRGTIIFNNNITLEKNTSCSPVSENPASHIIGIRLKSSSQPSGAPDATYIIFSIKSKMYQVHCIEKNYSDFKNLATNVFLIY